MVKPKKYLGQHFLKDAELAERITNSLTGHKNYSRILEIGPGTGVLTGLLIKKFGRITAAEIDRESIRYLKKQDYSDQLDIIEGDFLHMDIARFREETWGIIGNFPYNISTQLFFKFLKMRDSVLEVVCMLQKEVAERLASPPGNRKYGILSVLLQAYYTIEYLETVPPSVFDPPPKVESGVIRLKRNDVSSLACNEELFVRLVKQGFQNRRKTLRNAIKPLNLGGIFDDYEKLSYRAEQLTVDDFVNLTLLAEKNGTPSKI